MNGVLRRPTGPPVEEGDEALLLDRVPRVGSPGLLFLWTCVFAFFGVFIVGRLLRQPAAENVVLCVIFALMCFALLKSLWQTILGGERLRLDSGGLEYCWCFGLTRWRRLVPIEEIKSVSTYVKRVFDPIVGRARSEYGVQVETLGQPLRLGQSRQADDVAEIQCRIERRLRQLEPRWLSSTSSHDLEILERSSILAKPPSDCTIVCRREWDHTEFVRRWRLSWPRGLAGALVGFTVITATWFLAVRIIAAFDSFLLFSLAVRILLRAHSLELGWDHSRPPEVGHSPR